MREKADTKPWAELLSRRSAMSWVVAALLCLAIVGIAAFLLVNDYRAVEAEGQQRADNLAGIAAAQMTSTLSALDVGLRMVEMPEAGAGNGNREAALDRLADAIPAISDLRFIDTGAAAHIAKAADRETLLHHENDTDTGVRFSRLGQDGGTLLFSRRLSGGDGYFAGIVIGHLDVGYFSGFLRDLGADSATLRLAGQSRLTLFGRDGNPSGTAPFTAAATLNGYPLSVEIGLDRQKLMAAWESRRNVGIALVFVLLILVLGAVIAYRQHATQALTLAGLEAMTKMEAAARRRADEISRRK